MPDYMHKGRSEGKHIAIPVKSFHSKVQLALINPDHREVILTIENNPAKVPATSVSLLEG